MQALKLLGSGFHIAALNIRQAAPVELGFCGQQRCWDLGRNSLGSESSYGIHSERNINVLLTPVY
jgi:hypothetical protein